MELSYSRRQVKNVHKQQVVIVGAGIVGLSTAYALLKQGVKHVTLLEQATVDHPLSTSRGMSRLLRFEYGTDTFYPQLVRLSLSRWHELEHITNRTLYTPTGLLSLGNQNDKVTLAGHQVLNELGIASELLSESSFRKHFPQFNVQSYDLFTYNREAGMLYASYCLRTLKELVLAMGGQILEHSLVTGWASCDQHQPIHIQLSSGDECTAEHVVLATGPWLHRLLGDLQLPVRITHQYLLYFEHVPAALFNARVFPAFIAGDLYGFPLHSTGSGPYLLKVASHAFGSTIDPGESSSVNKQVINAAIAQVRALLPTLQDVELEHVDACMYDVSSDEDFILDYLPDDPRIVFATGLSGHGFKFGPVLGELLCSMVCGTEPVASLERFRLARFENIHVSAKDPVMESQRG